MLSRIILYSIAIVWARECVAAYKLQDIVSHKKVIRTTQNDSIRLERLIDLSWDYRDYDLDSAVYYSDWAIRLAKSIAQHRLLAKELDIRSSILIIKGNLDSAEYYQKQSLTLRQKIKNYSGLRSSYESMGDIKRSQGFYESALNYYFKALSTIDSIPYTPDEAELYEEVEFLNIETAYEYIKKYNFNAEKTAPVAKSAKYVHIASIKRLIGEVYLLKKDYINAKKYLSEALELNYRLLDHDQILINETSIAKLYLEENDLSTATLHATRAVRIGVARANYYKVATAFELLAEVQRRKKNFSVSLSYIDSADRYKKLFDPSENGDKLLVSRLRILVDSSELSQSESLEESLTSLARQINSRDVLASTNGKERLDYYFTLFAYYLSIGNKDSAIKYQTEYYLLKDSTIGLETQNRLTELLELHETEKRVKTIKSQAEQILNYTSLLIISAALIVIVILFSIYLSYRNRQIKRLHREVLDLNSQLVESTRNKEQLYSYIAHDLRGPLMTFGSVVNLLLNGDISESKREKYLRELQLTVNKSEMFTENLIHWAKTKTGAIRPLIKSVDMRKLLEEALNSFSHDIANKGLRLELSLAELSVETDRVLMQAIVSNLIQNAVRYSDDNAALHIYLGSTGDVWSLSVSNNGTPISQDMLHKFNESAIIHNESGHGLGLIIVKSYSQILGLSCQISSTEGSTTFTISNK